MLQLAPARSITNLLLLNSAAPKPRVAAELENVAAALLLPSVNDPSLQVAFAGGAMDLGDRVTCISGIPDDHPPFGSTGTVVGVYDDCCEVRTHISYVAARFRDTFVILR